jgi:hypothetical protein
MSSSAWSKARSAVALSGYQRQHDLAERKPFGVRGDMLPVPVNDAISGSARHEIGAHFECCVDLSLHHHMDLVESVTAAARQFEHAEPNHVTGFQT